MSCGRAGQELCPRKQDDITVAGHQQQRAELLGVAKATTKEGRRATTLVHPHIPAPSHNAAVADQSRTLFLEGRMVCATSRLTTTSRYRPDSAPSSRATMECNLGRVCPSTRHTRASTVPTTRLERTSTALISTAPESCMFPESHIPSTSFYIHRPSQ
jgi:hypothetical protein